ncbi:MAG: bifunctional 4-hydroxy-2-oxoglutarate aldolase/2-dehydro-3-deoxy-phosphogluconate aldolase [Xanthomonadales bacterium]|jgi:2-dehydro-3-deoxyphosphogluconate aldolase/(4S)-4-hydroxy-2-oxoglutarate aldolase|nr:bifunctional 4-hydroxy-2-oxoglutarate aldolase/2-dehydro-3-deoxy-phosphogluconate aldolase [Xanthomonadales bacterium]
MDASNILAGARVVPVVVLDDVAFAAPLAEVFLAAGLPAIEITLRTEAALACIERIARDVPDLVVGAGSVRDREQIPRVIDAGARFAVSPGHSNSLCVAAMDHQLPFVPGAVTAAEVLALREWGYTLVKFFPAELAGGLKMIQALSAPLPETRFFPTGGITPENAPAYLAAPQVACVGGSWLTPPDLLASRNLGALHELAAAAGGLG